MERYINIAKKVPRFFVIEAKKEFLNNLEEISKTKIIQTVINASAAVTLLEQRPEKNSGSERNP